jgi:hypothetical protein
MLIFLHIYENYLGDFYIDNIKGKMASSISPKSLSKYNCEYCGITCAKNTEWQRHLNTTKHKRNENGGNINQPATTHQCKCGKIYKDRSGLWRHEKKCDNTEINIAPPSHIITKDENPLELKFLTNLVLEVVKNNGELQKQNQEYQKQTHEYQKQNHEIQKQMMEVCKNSNINNNHSHNKTFNMQVFLNEQCKDAMNIMDFVNSMTLELSDLEDVGEVGYVEGISKIIIRKLNELDVCKRPIHCSDFKREIMYVRDMDVWTKENSTFDKIRKAIKYVTKKNGDLLIPWIQKYPTGMNIQHPHNDIYMRIMNQAMGGRESFIESENKIIKKISKAVQIDKSFNKC